MREINWINIRIFWCLTLLIWRSHHKGNRYTYSIGQNWWSLKILLNICRNSKRLSKLRSITRNTKILLYCILTLYWGNIEETNWRINWSIRKNSYTFLWIRIEEASSYHRYILFQGRKEISLKENRRGY